VPNKSFKSKQMELLIIIALVLLNGIFAMSEMSLVSSRKFKLEAAAKTGNKGAMTALSLSENPTRFLSTVQIGITLIGVFLGMYSGENLTKGVADFFTQFEAIKKYAQSIASGLVVVFVTYLSIVLGELFPKRLGLTFPEPIAMLLSRPMRLLSRITAPFVWLLTFSNNILVRIFNIKTDLDNKVTEEEIKSIIKESADGGEIQEIEQDIVERVFEMGDRKVISLMRHRHDISYFDENDSLDMVHQKITEEKHSAYPVCKDDDLDEIIGLVLLKDLFSPNIDKGFSLKNHLHKPIYITENTLGYNLLERFKAEKMNYAIVIDEFGATKGFVTKDDVVDALVSDVSDKNHTEYSIVQRDEKSWLVDGRVAVIEFLKYFDLPTDKVSGQDYVTLAGLFISKFKGLPEIGDKILFGDYELKVLDKDGQRIDKILVTEI
jgi:putative hemolysin